MNYKKAFNILSISAMLTFTGATTVYAVQQDYYNQDEVVVSNIASVKTSSYLDLKNTKTEWEKNRIKLIMKN